MNAISTNLLRAFRNNRKKFLAMVLDFLRVNPIIIFHLAIFFRFPSPSSFLMIIVGGVAGNLWINIKLMLNLTLSIVKIITGCLNQCLEKGVSGESHTMQQFFPTLFEDHKDVFEDMEKWLIQMNGLRRVAFEQMVKIHIAPGSDLCKCYTNTQLFVSHIFFNNIPKEDEGVQKFFVLHEIGHTFVRMMTQPIDLVVGLAAYMFYLFWIAISINWTIDSFIVVVTFVLGMTIWRGEHRQRVKTGILLDEILADCMAIEYLSKKDLQQVSKNRLVPILLADKTMTPLHNSIRLAKLRENIDLTMKGKSDQVFEEVMLGYLPESDITLLLVAVLLILMPAFYGRSPFAGDLIRAIVIALLLVLLFIASVFLYSVVDSILEKKLTDQFPKR